MSRANQTSNDEDVDDEFARHLNAKKSEFDARQHPVVKIVLTAIIGIAVLMLMFCFALDRSDKAGQQAIEQDLVAKVDLAHGDSDSGEDPKTKAPSTLSMSWYNPNRHVHRMTTADWSELHGEIESSVIGLVCELLVGGIMLFIFVEKVYKEDELRRQLWVLFWCITFAVCCAFIGYIVWPNVWAGLLWSVAIEIVGSVLFFAVVEAVIDALNEDKKKGLGEGANT